MLDPTPIAGSGDGADSDRWLTAVISPLDGMLLRPHTDASRRVGCCRPDGSAGPNLMCGSCGAEVGIEISDCWTEFDVRLLLAEAVQDDSVGGLAQPPTMSMIGEYLRVTAAELARAIRDPDWALDFVEEVQDTEEETEPAPAEARHYSTYKTWDMLRFLLARAEFPVNVILGEEPFAEDEDWGYGHPRYLRPERVRLAAEALRATTYTQLIHDMDPAELTTAEVYPLGWNEPGSLEWARPWYDGLTRFFEAAAGSDDAMLVWLD